MRSEAATVDAYLDELPQERRETAAELRSLLRAHLPPGYVEAMNWGMICYEVPLERTGATYNGRPLMYAGIGAQKNHVGLYLCGLYCDAEARERFVAAHRASGRRLDMGKACIRVRRIDDLDREAVATAIASQTVDDFVATSQRKDRK